MKKTKVYWFYLLAVVGIISLLPGSCKKQDVPVLTTSEIVSIAYDTAGIGGVVLDDGGSSVTDRGICWSTSSGPTISGDKISLGSGPGSFSGSLKDLSASTTYYVKSYATNGVGTAYGNEVSFTTSAPELASVKTSEVSDVTSYTAISGGEVLSDGGADITDRGICWSNTSEPTVDDSKLSGGSGIGSFESGIKDLRSGDKYYLRAYAISAAGVAYGEVFSFSTPEISNKAYTVTTTSITNITSTSASSGGSISGTGSTIVQKGVCWSTSTGPTLSDSYTNDGSGTSSFTSSLTGLSASTTYYVRAYAATSRDVTYGDELYFSTSGGSPTVPTLTTTTVTNITSSTASSGGNITSDGGASVTARGVCWSTSQNPTLSDSYTTDGTGTGSYSSSLTSLSASTTYYVRAYATNSVGTAYGDQVYFSTTGSATTPTVTTSSISDISCYTASGGGNVTSDGGASVTARGVCWSTSQNPTTSNSHTTDGTGTGSYSSSLTSLSLNTTYYVRAYATNSEGTSYGDQVSFSTTYYLTTTAISNITSSTASSGGNIYCDGGSAVTARGVCWSTSQNPTLSDSHTTDGTGTGSFTSSITGLSASTTYYVRAYGTNSSGSAYGNQVSFTTSAGASVPTLTTTSISNITSSTASSGGNITSDGGASVTARGVCWSTSQNPTTADSHTSDGTGTGSYSSSLTSLSASTLYYVRAYATNSVGTAYGNQQSFTTSSSGGTTYYVSTTGDDSDPGSQSEPWLTIQKAANTMTAGDQVYVANGTYNERVSITSSGTSEGSRIKFISTNEHGAKCLGFLVNGDYITIDGFEVESNTTYLRGIVVEGETYTDIFNNYVHDCPKGGISVTYDGTTLSSYADVSDNLVEHNGSWGINIVANNCLIEGNEITETVQLHSKITPVPTFNGEDADGMRIFGDYHIIRGNQVLDICDPSDPDNNRFSTGEGAHSDGIQTWDGGPSGIPVMSNTTIEGNYFRMIHPSGKGIQVDVNNGGECHDLLIMNNIFEFHDIGISAYAGDYADILIYNNVFKAQLNETVWGCGIALSNVDNYQVKNNILVDCHPEPRSITSSTGTVDYNAFWFSNSTTPNITNPTLQANEINAQDPDFDYYSSTVGSNDYHLDSGSPCVDTGTTVNDVTEDFDGVSRPQNSVYDMGAYEQ